MRSISCCYDDDRGLMVYDRKFIALNYVRGFFIIDLVTTFPVYLIEGASSSSSSFNMLRLVRLPRVYKLAKVFYSFFTLLFSFNTSLLYKNKGLKDIPDV